MSLDCTVRESVADDALGLTELLNEIILVGGTTAHENPYTADYFEETYITGDDVLTCVTAEDSKGNLLGFQSVGKNADLPENWGDIGTFSHIQNTTKGVGTALFGKTRTLTTSLHLEALNATIRADNTGGLIYYNKMGFVDYDRHLAIPLNDGTPIDRICKRFLLKWY